MVDTLGFRRSMGGSVDAWARNVWEREAVLGAVFRALKPCGRLYMAFPCEESGHCPRSRGTQDLYENVTHAWVLNWDPVLSAIRRAGMHVEFSAKRYRALCLATFGLLWEPISALFAKATSATWVLYGFESIIWGSRSTNLQR